MTKVTTKEKSHMGEVVLYFLRLGLLGFGGPVALVGQMERELVSDRKGLSKTKCAKRSRFVSRCRVHSQSKSASIFPTCGQAFGAHGPAAGRLFFQIL